MPTRVNQRRPYSGFDKVFGRRTSNQAFPAVEVHGDGGFGLAVSGQFRGSNNLSDRYELMWRAGERGHPCINADMASGTEATREPADPNFEVLGTNSTSALSTFNAAGGITFTTAATSGDQMILAPHLDTAQSAWAQTTWSTAKQLVWQALISSPATITSNVYWAGLKLTNTSVVATDDDQCFFRYAAATASGKWQCVYSIAGTDVTVTTDITVAASTKYYLRIELDSARVPYFYINGVLVATGTALTSGGLIPYIGVQTATTAARALNIYGQSISQTAV